MTDAPRLDIQACHRLMADGKRSGTGDLSPELADQLKAALVLLSEARDVLANAYTEPEMSLDGIRKMVDEVHENKAACESLLARIPDLGELTR